MKKKNKFAKSKTKKMDRFELDTTEWINLKKEAMACFALTGLLANPDNDDIEPAVAAKKAIEFANALYNQTLLKPTPVEEPEPPDETAV